MIIKRQYVEDALEAIGCYDFDEVIRDDYSGRGMYGDTCFGIVVEDIRQAFMFFVMLSDVIRETNPSDSDDVSRLAEKATMDSMGMGSIVYFPRVTLEA